MNPGDRVVSTRDGRRGTVGPQRWPPMVRVDWDDGSVTHDAIDFLAPET